MRDERLSAVRRWLAERHVDAVIIPVHDEWLNEYPPACNRRVEWLTGFSGSAGVVIVLAKKAALFVDGRYTLQARTEVDGSQLEVINSGEMKPEEWLKQQTQAPQPTLSQQVRGLSLAYDPALFTKAMLQRYEKISQVELIANPCPVDALWQDRPLRPHTPLMVYDDAFAGEASASKRTRMADKIKELGADAAVITAPDSVCWLLNIRARDVVHTPLVLAPVILSASGEVQLFIEASRVSAEVSAHLGNHVALREPQQLKQVLGEYSGKAVLLDPQSASVFYREALLADGATLIEKDDPCQLAKATKNDMELEHIRRVHKRDGLALVRLLCWLEHETNRRRVTEIEVADQLLHFRKQAEGFLEPSFDTIAGSGPNGAIVHYRATEKSNRALEKGELFLLDSGGQYWGGTTDVTRTVLIGDEEATLDQSDHFTRVLRGHIAIATVRFPAGVTGGQLDSLARQFLWKVWLDYDHGTGHGVGCFLGVHEGPQRISKRAGDQVALAEGMVISNEPGFYKEGEYGIRIENLVAVREDIKGWLSFETLTCAPIDTRLVNVLELSVDEQYWLNDYHDWVFKQHEPYLDAHERAWLKRVCAPI